MFSPYMAMIPEQCQTEKNRVLVASLQGLFSIFGSVIGILLPMILQSMLEDPTKTKWWQPSGAFLIGRIPFIGGLFAFIGAAFLLLTFFTTDESFQKTNLAQNQKKTIKETFQQVFQPIQDPKYKPFLVQTVFWNMGMRILMVVILPLLTFVLLLQGVEFIIFVLIIIPFAFGGFLFWNLKIPKYGLLSGYRYSILISIIMLFLTPIFLLEFSPSLKLVLAVLIMGLALACLVAGFLFPTPIVSALIDEAALSFAQTRDLTDISLEDRKNDLVSQLSGGYYGLFSFTINFSSGLANLILGGIFTGSNADNPFYIVLSLPVAAILFFLAWSAIRKLSLKNSK
jgi:Na+/melibiose symporter-like transporter